jgi:hypothetical protein
MKRPTRVPASTVVRMNSASNMIAKWYQNALSASPPKTPEKIVDMPTARVGAPPTRAIRLCSWTDCAAAWSWSGVMVKPSLVTASAADWALVPTTPAGAFMAK